METHYSVNEWLDHADLFARLTLTQDDRDGSAVVDRVFEGRYATAQEAEYKKARFAAAMRYLDLNRDSFNEGDFAVFGKEEGMVKGKLYAALWTVFHDRRDDELDDFVSPDLVKRVASGIEDALKPK